MPIASWMRARRTANASRRAPRDSALAAYYQTPTDTAVKVTDASLLAVDIETTGLDAAYDQILSIGWVAFKLGDIAVSSARHQVVNASPALRSENVAIHGLTGEDLAQGESLEAVLTQLLETLAGKVMVAHGAKIESVFLDRACQLTFGAPLVAPTLCTLKFEQHRFSLGNRSAQADDFRLPQCLKRYNLPIVGTHNAAEDALSAAMLFCAQVRSAGAEPRRVSQLKA